MTPSQVTVVVVSFNTKDKLRRCLACIEANHEVIVVDNASNDGSATVVAEEFPHVQLIRNDKNLGFGQANDQGISRSTRDFVLLLNSDAYADPGAIALLASAITDDVVAVGGRQVNPDETLQDSSANELTLWAVFCEQAGLEKLLPNSKIFCPYWNTRRLRGTSDTSQVMGATMMVNMKKVRQDATETFRPWRPQFDHQGIFDPRYFLYCEDTDLCYRLSRFGRILYVSNARFIHELGSSSSQDRWKSVARYNRGKELYFEIHHGKMAALVCLGLNRAGAIFRFLLWSFLFPRSNGRIRLFWSVLTAPRLGPPDPRSSNS